MPHAFLGMLPIINIRKSFPNMKNQFLILENAFLVSKIIFNIVKYFLI